MSIREIRCGSSSEVLGVGSAVPATPEGMAARLATRLHLPAAKPAPSRFCVVGVCPRGRESFLWMASSRAEAAQQMHAHRGRFPVIRLQQWVGPVLGGRWELVAIRIQREARGLHRRGRCRRQKIRSNSHR